LKQRNKQAGSVEEQGKKEYEAKYGKVIQDKVSYFEALKPKL
jgi:peptidylprolyl isomerase